MFGHFSNFVNLEAIYQTFAIVRMLKIDNSNIQKHKHGSVVLGIPRIVIFEKMLIFESLNIWKIDNLEYWKSYCLLENFDKWRGVQVFWKCEQLETWKLKSLKEWDFEIKKTCLLKKERVEPL